MRIAPLAVLLVTGVAAHAEIRLPKLFSSHAVLQRDRPIHLWGWAAPGEQVSAAFDGRSQHSTADRLGNWNIYLPPHAAGGPFRLNVSGSNQIQLDDILVGDVWFASGQSNMEMPLSGFPGSAVVKNAAEEIRNAGQPSIRLLFIPHEASAYPLADFDGVVHWQSCTPETAAKFSAVAYFFGRGIAAQEHVPVGLIDSSWGGTPVEAWVSGDALAADASLMPVFASWAEMAGQQAGMAALVGAEKSEDEAARAADSKPPKHPWHPNPASWDPSWLFNGMVAPAAGFEMKGVIWYQGESNTKLDREPLYHKVFSTMIADWRRHWHQGNFPFLFTQISSFTSDETENWPAIREAQLRTLSVAHTAMAVTIDIGNPTNVHPSDKQTVGARLALAARAVVYGENIEYSGPLFRQSSTEPGAIRLWFDHAQDGLKAEGGSLEGFEVAGEDHRFFPADAHIDGLTVVASSPQVQAPKFARYAWRNAPSANLFNAADLPASPFTSE